VWDIVPRGQLPQGGTLREVRVLVTQGHCQCTRHQQRYHNSRNDEGGSATSSGLHGPSGSGPLGLPVIRQHPLSYHRTSQGPGRKWACRHVAVIWRMSLCGRRGVLTSRSISTLYPINDDPYLHLRLDA
jgi:hypothetical protein